MTSPRSRDSRLGELVAAGVNADVYEWLGGLGSSSLVVKIHRGDGAASRALAEAVALSGATHRHVVPLIDVALVAGADSLGLILPRLGSRSASTFVADRGVLAAGEAVTLLAPVLMALQHLERSPLARHVDLVSGVGLGNVLLDRHGAPVVVGVRAAPARGPQRLARPPGGATAAGRRAIDQVLPVCSGIGADQRRRFTELCDESTTLDELVEALFDLAAPVALDDEAPFEMMPVHDEVETMYPLDDLVPGLATLRTWAHRLSAGGRAFELAAQAGAAARQVRKRVWVLAGAVVGCAAIGLAVGGGGAGGGGAGSANDDRGVAATSAEGSGPPGRATGTTPGGRATATPTPTPSTSTGPRADRHDQVEAVLAGDDADRAVRLLLRLRADCFRALDAECLAGVDEPGSAALAEDERVVADPALLESVPEIVVGTAINRLGGVVLFDATSSNDEPASVFVVKTEAGWRVRSIDSG
ncbi:hypothetical protein [Frondihabitans sp. Leaf304]|uniref:hypothetical protein n=1 Tax=Frondihabitans sp. Leaf304 TaxID=1736329 RepID=UPI0006FAE3A4|nr:hypothetical protein [Frondihabitans sp. Leaf304]KQQ27570.1 hypothetical protein ASF54_01915 [Frondihabitans sp. Leaf304]